MAGSDVCVQVYVCATLYRVVCSSTLVLFQPKLNEQPVVEAGRKRTANDENQEPVSSDLLPTKQPRTIDINLPNRWEDFTNSENTTKGIRKV